MRRCRACRRSCASRSSAWCGCRWPTRCARGNHLRTTLFLGRMPSVAQRAVLIANSLVGIALFVMIAWLGWIELAKSYEIGAFEGEHPVRIPVWPIWAILVGGAVLTAVQFALDALRYLTEGPRRVGTVRGRGHSAPDDGSRHRRRALDRRDLRADPARISHRRGARGDELRRGLSDHRQVPRRREHPADHRLQRRERLRVRGHPAVRRDGAVRHAIGGDARPVRCGRGRCCAASRAASAPRP